MSETTSSNPNRSVKLTPRGKAAAGVLVAAGVLGYGMAEHPENPVGGVIQDTLQVGINVIDTIPGVDVAEVNVPTSEQAENLKQGTSDAENLYIPDQLQDDYTQWNDKG